MEPECDIERDEVPRREGAGGVGLDEDSSDGVVPTPPPTPPSTLLGVLKLDVSDRTGMPGERLCDEWALND